MEHNKQYYRELSQKIETGEYFEEAREWYIKKYLQYFIERTYLIILLSALLVIGVISINYYFDILPIKKSLPVKVTISNTADFSTRITYLGSKTKDFDINEILIKYFSKRFVDAIESYDYRNDFQKLKINKNIIQTLGSDEILAYYLDKISIRNRDSILLKYRKNTMREIKVADAIDIAKASESKSTVTDNFAEIKKTDDDNKTKKYQITVNFDANEIDKDGTQTKTKWQSKIILSFQTIVYTFDKKEFSPLNFKVLSYESKKVE